MRLSEPPLERSRFLQAKVRCDIDYGNAAPHERLARLRAGRRGQRRHDQVHVRFDIRRDGEVAVEREVWESVAKTLSGERTTGRGGQFSLRVTPEEARRLHPRVSGYVDDANAIAH
jgi:hypothetical protein